MNTEKNLQILVWHTRTVQVSLKNLKYPSKDVNSSSASELFGNLEELKLANFSSNGNHF